MYDIRPDQRIIEGDDDRSFRVKKLKMDFSKKLTMGFFFVCVIALAGCQELVPQDTASLFLPKFHKSEIIGLLAGFGTTFAAVPDLIAMLRRRSSAGMNPRMAGIMGVFQILWVYYGLLIVSRPVVVWNIIAVATNFFSVGAYLYYARRERESR